MSEDTTSYLAHPNRHHTGFEHLSDAQLHATVPAVGLAGHLHTLECAQRALPLVGSTPAYTLSLEAPGTEPAGFDSHPPVVLIGDSAALFADVRRKYREGLPFSNKAEAANWFRLSEVLDHAEAALAASQQLAEATRELEYERQMRQQTEEAMSTLAGRVKEQQAELAEQERAKLRLVLDNKSLNKRLTDALDSLGDMYGQYCPGEYGHDFMSAGEGAQDVLGQEGLLDDAYNFTGIPPQPEG